MRCPNCGRISTADSIFCESCGTKLDLDFSNLSNENDEDTILVSSSEDAVVDIPKMPKNPTVQLKKQHSPKSPQSQQGSTVTPQQPYMSRPGPTPITPPNIPPTASAGPASWGTGSRIGTVPVQTKKNHAVVIIAVILCILIILITVGLVWLFHVRAENQSYLATHLSEWMLNRCETDIINNYDRALSKSYDQNGYTITPKDNTFHMTSTEDGNIFAVSGKVDIRDGNTNSYGVDINGTVATNFLRTRYTWDLSCDCEQPPAIASVPSDTTQNQDQNQNSSTTPIIVQTPAPVITTVPNTPNTQTITPTQSYYLWPTNTSYITYSDLDQFSRKQVMLLRNELYARHGCTFQDDEIRNYFLSQSWYSPVSGRQAVEFSTSQFNDYERKNLETIQSYEHDMGWKP